MLHDMSLDELLRQKLEEQIENPLHFEAIEFETSEWSNIPALVPHYILHLNNHLKALINYCRFKDGEESSQELRNDVFKNIQLRDEKFAKLEKDNDKEHNKINGRVIQVDKRVDDTNHQHQLHLMLLKSQAAEDLSAVMHLSDPNLLKREFDVSEETTWLESVTQSLGDQLSINDPRGFSLSQIKQLLSLGLTKSATRQQVLANKADIETLRQVLGSLLTWKGDYEDQMKKRFQQVDDHFAAVKKHSTQFEQDTVRKIQDLYDKHDYTTKKVMKNQQALEENVVFQDMIQNRCNALNDKLKQTKDGLKEDLELQKKLILKRVDELNLEQTNQISNVQNEMSKLKKDLSDLVEMKNDSVLLQMDKEVHKVQTIFEEFRREITQTKDELLNKNKLQITKIKDTCASYFDKTDKISKKCAKSVIEIEKTFESWKVNVMKPTQMAEARLFSIETQVFENESERVAEFQYTKDIFRKLVMAIENQLQQVTQKQAVYSHYAQNFANSQNETQYGGGTTGVSQTPLIKSSQLDNDEGILEFSLNQPSVEQSKIDLPNLTKTQPMFIFGQPAEFTSTSYNRNQSLSRRRHERSNSFYDDRSNNQGLVTGGSGLNVTTQNQSIQHSYANHVNHGQNASPALGATAQGPQNIFKQRINFIKTALEQDSLLIQKYKDKIPLRHKNQYKINYKSETPDVSHLDGPNGQPKQFADYFETNVIPSTAQIQTPQQVELMNLTHHMDSLNTDMIVAGSKENNGEPMEMRRLSVQPGPQKVLINGKLSPNNRHHFLSNQNSIKRTNNINNSLNKYKIHHAEVNVNNQMDQSDTTIEYSLTQKSNLKTISFNEGNHLMPKYSKIYEVEQLIKNKTQRLEQELTDKKIHKKQGRGLANVKLENMTVRDGLEPLRSKTRNEQTVVYNQSEQTTLVDKSFLVQQDSQEAQEKQSSNLQPAQSGVNQKPALIRFQVFKSKEHGQDKEDLSISIKNVSINQDGQEKVEKSRGVAGIKQLVKLVMGKQSFKPEILDKATSLSPARDLSNIIEITDQQAKTTAKLSLIKTALSVKPVARDRKLTSIGFSDIQQQDQTSNQIAGKDETVEKNQTKEEGNDGDEVLKQNSMVKSFVARLSLKQKEKEKIKMEQERIRQQERNLQALVSKFQTHIKGVFRMETQKRKAMKKPEKITLEECMNILTKTDLNFMTYQQFRQMITTPEVLKTISWYFYSLQMDDERNEKKRFKLGEIEDGLASSEKDLFLQFRGKQISLDQLRARVSERQGVATYKVLDDIKDDLHPSVVEDLDRFEQEIMTLIYKEKMGELTVGDLLRPLAEWEYNPRCLRSIQYKPEKQSGERIEVNWDNKIKSAQDQIAMTSIQKFNVNSVITKTDAQLDDQLRKKRLKEKILDPIAQQMSYVNKYMSEFPSIQNKLDRGLNQTQKGKISVEASNPNYDRYQVLKMIREQYSLKVTEVIKRKGKKHKKTQHGNLDAKDLQKIAEQRLKQREFDKDRRNLIFLKKLQEDGQNVQVNELCSFIIGYQNDLEKAIEEDTKTGDEMNEEDAYELSQTQIKSTLMQKTSRLREQQLNGFQTYSSGKLKRKLIIEKATSIADDSLLGSNRQIKYLDQSQRDLKNRSDSYLTQPLNRDMKSQPKKLLVLSTSHKEERDSEKPVNEIQKMAQSFRNVKVPEIKVGSLKLEFLDKLKNRGATIDLSSGRNQLNKTQIYSDQQLLSSSNRNIPKDSSKTDISSSFRQFISSYGIPLDSKRVPESRNFLNYSSGRNHMNVNITLRANPSNLLDFSNDTITENISYSNQTLPLKNESILNSQKHLNIKSRNFLNSINSSVRDQKSQSYVDYNTVAIMHRIDKRNGRGQKDKIKEMNINDNPY